MAATCKDQSQGRQICSWWLCHGPRQSETDGARLYDAAECSPRLVTQNQRGRDRWIGTTLNGVRSVSHGRKVNAREREKDRERERLEHARNRLMKSKGDRGRARRNTLDQISTNNACLPKGVDLSTFLCEFRTNTNAVSLNADAVRVHAVGNLPSPRRGLPPFFSPSRSSFSRLAALYPSVCVSDCTPADLLLTQLPACPCHLFQLSSCPFASSLGPLLLSCSSLPTPVPVSLSVSFHLVLSFSCFSLVFSSYLTLHQY